MKRRDFVKTTALGATAVVLGPGRALAAETPAAAQAMPTRPYAKGGPELSVIGFPGLVMARLDQAKGSRLVAESVERGINYFDVAPAYGDAEVKLGPALEPFRKKVFLACKTKMRDRDGAKAEFERSLQRLRTNRFELYQLHCLANVAKDVDAAFAKGGVMEYVVEQQKAGRIRYIGFSAHTEEAALAAMDRFKFDSVMFPIGFSSWLKAGFGPDVVAKAEKQGATVVSIKAFCRQRWTGNDPDRQRFRMWYKPVSDRAEAEMALRFALSQGTVRAAIPPANVEVHKLAMDVAATLRPVTDGEVAKLQAIADEVDPLFPQQRRKG